MTRVAFSLAMCVASVAMCTMALGQTGGAGAALLDEGFEAPEVAALTGDSKQPAGWDLFSSEGQMTGSGLVATGAKAGAQAYRLASVGKAESYQGLFRAVSVKPQQEYRLHVAYRPDSQARPDASAALILSIEWKDAQGAEISRVESKPLMGNAAKDQWADLELAATAPARAAKAHCVLIVRQLNAGSAGAFLLDQVQALPGAAVAQTPSVAPAATVQKPIVDAATAEKKAYQWLVRQQNATGLLGNQDSEDFSGLYPNAMAAMCFTHQRDFDRAHKLLAFYHHKTEQEFAAGSPGGFRQFWNAATGEVYPDADRWIGDNAWLLIALNYYKNVTGKTDFDSTRQKIAQWLLSLQDTNGGILCGFNKNGPMKFFSTEGNLDCISALEVEYPDRTAKIRHYLTTAMWVPEDKRFKMGSTVDESGLDCSSWAIAVLGPSYASTLAYAEKRFLRTDVSDGNGHSIRGFADFVDRQRIWLEGTGQMALAYRLVGREAEGQEILQHMRAAMVPSQRFADLIGLPGSTSDPSWDGASRKIFVPSQAWYLMAAWKFNPMAIPVR